ncbi:MAG TPA: hypothetical protein PKW79_04190 [Rhabdochlamydiaceae bacterium]|nr:hypothetical protein [Rhabdochlamydiaceae bacterium]
MYLVFLRDLTWRTLEGGEEFTSLKKRFGRLVQERYPEELQLPQAYLSLLSHLLKLPTFPIRPQQFPNGATVLDGLGLIIGGQVPELAQIAELGSLWMILGVVLKNDALIYSGLKMAVWQFHTLDHQGIPHLSLWSKADSFTGKKLTAYNHLLFSLAYRLTKERAFAKVAQMQESDRQSLPGKLLHFISEQYEPAIRLSYRPLLEEMTVGLLKFTTPVWSMACTLSGFNSGMFSYHKKRVAILNSGPQVQPLDDAKLFGIERSCSLKTRRFSETTWEKTAHHFRFKGWTKVHALPTWMETDYYFQAQKLNFSCFFQEGRPLDQLYLAFYCRGDKVTVGGKLTLERGRITKYQGKSSPLEILADDEVIYLEPGSETEMEVIPLSGGDEFWGADFLIALKVYKNALKFVIK